MISKMSCKYLTIAPLAFYWFVDVNKTMTPLYQLEGRLVLCYVMLCYVMLCYVMLCYVMLCYVMLCYVMLSFSVHSVLFSFKFGFEKLYIVLFSFQHKYRTHLLRMKI
jgi:hypothetical protein